MKLNLIKLNDLNNIKYGRWNSDKPRTHILKHHLKQVIYIVFSLCLFKHLQLACLSYLTQWHKIGHFWSSNTCIRVRADSVQADFFLLRFADNCVFLQIEGLWQACTKQVYRCHFSNSICSLRVSGSHFVNSCNISNF